MYHPEKVEGFSQHLLNHLCNGYSFMMLDENIDLRDQFDQVIEEMKEDGTLEELVKIHITDAANSGKRFYEQSKGKNGSAKIEVEDDFLCPGLYLR